MKHVPIMQRNNKPCQDYSFIPLVRHSGVRYVTYITWQPKYRHLLMVSVCNKRKSYDRNVKYTRKRCVKHSVQDGPRSATTEMSNTGGRGSWNTRYKTGHGALWQKCQIEEEEVRETLGTRRTTERYDRNVKYRRKRCVKHSVQDGPRSPRRKRKKINKRRKSNTWITALFT